MERDDKFHILYAFSFSIWNKIRMFAVKYVKIGNIVIYYLLLHIIGSAGK
jgi:hypothetical protein